MPTALADMQPWRRFLVEHGLTYRWLGDRTGRAEITVRSYANGMRRPPDEWLAAVADLLERYKRGEVA